MKMKKIILFLAVVGLTFLSSCEGVNSSHYLEGTIWKGAGTEIVFGTTHATITQDMGRERPNVFTGTYTYDPPKVMISGDVWDFEGRWIQFDYEVNHIGTVKGSTMEIGIIIFDMGTITKLKKQ